MSSGYNVSMAIRMTFPDPSDSPTGAAVIRLRYRLDPPNVVLHYAHGTRTLTREAWDGYQAAGALLSANTPVEKNAIRTALGVDL